MDTAVPTPHALAMPRSLSMRETWAHRLQVEEAFEFEVFEPCPILAWELPVFTVPEKGGEGCALDQSGAARPLPGRDAHSLTYAGRGHMLFPPSQDRRQHPRIRAAWSVIVKVGKSRYLGRSVDLSTHGAKVRTNVRLKAGTTVQLELVPPEGLPLRVDALVWRADADGLAFLFSHTIQHRLIPPI